MNKLRLLIYKDWLLLLRDKAGLCMMFLMPALLVVIMAYLQDSTFNSIHETQIPLLLLNKDQDSLGGLIEKKIEQSPIFKIDKGAAASTKEEMIKWVARGDYMIGIFIPEQTTHHIRKRVQQYVADIFNDSTVTAASDTLCIDIFIDPATKSSFRATLMSALREYATRIESEFILKEVGITVNRFLPIPIASMEFPHEQIVFREQYASVGEGAKIPNSVQHNVPAWTMFAIFFIVISLSGNIIKEREEGSYTRLRVMPCPYGFYLGSKVALYLMVCLLQLVLLLLMGVFVLPLLGLPALQVGSKYVALFLVGFSSALAAIGYGIAIGKVATTHQQAAIFGSISVVIMAAIGGIWIPVFVMPRFMQLLSRISPLNWGLEGFYTVFVREGNWISVLPECAVSLLFFALCISFAMAHNRNKLYLHYS